MRSLKITLRNLFHKGWEYSWINIVGMAVGLTAVILIMLWVWDEMSFDRFHKRSKDIYQTNVQILSMDRYGNFACAPLAFAAKEQIPEIENACRGISWWRVDMLQNRERDAIVSTEISCGMVDSTFFSIFDFQVLEGDLRRMLVDSESIVLTESIAGQLFGDQYPIGAALFDNNQRQYRVTGVIADMPRNSSIRFDILLPFTFFEQMNPATTTDWVRPNYQTWFLLRPRADVADVEAKIAELVNPHIPEDFLRYSLQSIESLNLYNADGSANSKAQTCKMFLIIALALILVACINYVNITTARVSYRIKEIFMRYILGARKLNLFFQFLKESTLLFLISLIMAIFMLYILFPVFNRIAGKQLDFHLFSVPTLTVFGLTFITVVICAGIYPAINLALRKPLQGISKKRGNVFLRRTLVVLQFVVAIALVSITITVGKQLEYMKKKDLGYEKENVFYVHLGGTAKHYNSIRTELSRIPSILGVTATSMSLSNVTSLYEISDFEGSEVENLRTIMVRTDNDFFSTMNIPLLAGRSFGISPHEDDIILNETAVTHLGITDPVGKTCMIDGRKRTVIGVVQDFHFKSLYTPIEPLIIMNDNQKNVLYVKASNADIPQAISAVENIWKQYNPNLPFLYSFLDDEFQTVYKTDIQSGVLFRIFAILAIFVSCLGLFGLVTYAAETKTKEIAIRKVMGASVSGIVKMISKKFMILVGIAMPIAFLLAYHLSGKILRDYAYRIDIGWWIFAASAVIAIVLTLFTVGWRAFKAATANPVKAIKTE